jgi:hypothetical protein
MKDRRQVGGRYLARARGAFGFARLAIASSTRNSADIGRAARRGPNVTQYGQDLTDNPGVNAELNVAYEGKTKEKLKIQNDDMTDAAFYQFLLKAYQNLASVTKEGAGIYVFHANRPAEVLMATMRSRRVSRAFQTCPMPPSPIRERISYGPSFAPGFNSMGQDAMIDSFYPKKATACRVLNWPSRETRITNRACGSRSMSLRVSRRPGSLRQALNTTYGDLSIFQRRTPRRRLPMRGAAAHHFEGPLLPGAL